MNGTTTVLIVAVVVLLVVARRIYGEPLRARQLLFAPVVELAIGGYELATHGGLPAGEWISLAVTGVLSLALGAARGGTLHLFERRGYLWQRYRPRTFAVWAVAFAARFGVRWLLAAVGLTQAGFLSGHGIAAIQGISSTMVGTMLITSGLGFVGESLVLTPRALASGVPLAPPGARAGLLGGLLGGAGEPGRRVSGDATTGLLTGHSPNGQRRHGGLFDALFDALSADRGGRSSGATRGWSGGLGGLFDAAAHRRRASVDEDDAGRWASSGRQQGPRGWG